MQCSHVLATVTSSSLASSTRFTRLLSDPSYVVGPKTMRAPVMVSDPEAGVTVTAVLRAMLLFGKSTEHVPVCV